MILGYLTAQVDYSDPTKAWYRVSGLQQDRDHWGYFYAPLLGDLMRIPPELAKEGGQWMVAIDDATDRAWFEDATDISREQQPAWAETIGARIEAMDAKLTEVCRAGEWIAALKRAAFDLDWSLIRDAQTFAALLPPRVAVLIPKRKVFAFLPDKPLLVTGSLWEYDDPQGPDPQTILAVMSPDWSLTNPEWWTIHIARSEFVAKMGDFTLAR